MCCLKFLVSLMRMELLAEGFKLGSGLIVYGGLTTVCHVVEAKNMKINMLWST